MTDPGEQPTETLGQPGEGCSACGAPLAVDQRYCLNCGKRRAGPRVEYRQHLPGSSNGAAPTTEHPQVPPPDPGAVAKKPERDYTPLAAVGGIAVLGLMLLVGVLIGKGNSSESSSAPAPVVIQKGGEAEAGGAEATADTAKPKKTPKNTTAAAKPAKKANDASSLTAGGGGGGPVEASDKALEELEQSGDYSDQSAKLPDEIATGGAPPPEDSKAPGGGSKGTAIE